MQSIANKQRLRPEAFQATSYFQAFSTVLGDIRVCMTGRASWSKHSPVVRRPFFCTFTRPAAGAAFLVHPALRGSWVIDNFGKICFARIWSCRKIALPEFGTARKLNITFDEVGKQGYSTSAGNNTIPFPQLVGIASSASKCIVDLGGWVVRAEGRPCSYGGGTCGIPALG